jgi:site-specific recombinase XerD
VQQQIDVMLNSYAETLDDKADGTSSAYLRLVRRLLLAHSPDGLSIDMTDITRDSVRDYLHRLETTGYSLSHVRLVKAAMSSFARWSIDHRLLDHNPTRGLGIQRMEARPPRVLTDAQRCILLELAARSSTARTPALFALGYWAGVRASGTSHLQLADCDFAADPPTIQVGFKNDKQRTIALLSEAHEPLHAYVMSDERDVTSAYVFTSQRTARLTESGLHAWFRRFKASADAPKDELIADLTYHDLRHDFAHRMRERGWTLEELALYLGHTNQQGWPVVAATLRYTQAGHADILARMQEAAGD